MIDRVRPTHVTRFYSQDKYARELIRTRLITFIHVDLVNDPFDPYMFFETNFGDSYTNLLKHVQQNYPQRARELATAISEETWKSALDEIRAVLSSLRKKMYMISTCAEHDGKHPKNNLYMWGHYGNGHRGVAVEFNSENLKRDILAHHASLSNKPVNGNVWAKMQYQDTVDPITADAIYHYIMKHSGHQGFDETLLDKILSAQTITKSKNWEPENEWRLMWENDLNKSKVRTCPINKDSIENIFIGLQAKPGLDNTILQNAKRNFPGAKVYRAMKRPGQFALDFKILNSK